LAEVQLRVLDARQRDVARGIARIDQITMQSLRWRRNRDNR